MEVISLVGVKKCFMALAMSTVMIVTLAACGRTGEHKLSSANESTQEMMDSIDIQDDDSEEWEEESGKSLNDIRFADFEEKDWLDNEYIRALRRYLDAFNKGEIEDEELEPYREYVGGKFCLFSIQPFLLGGMLIHFVFYDNPEYLFKAWVYSDVNEDTKEIVNYHVNSASIEDMIYMTTEDVQDALNEHPEMKLW